MDWFLQDRDLRHERIKEMLDHHATVEVIKLWGNTKPHINKTLNKSGLVEGLLNNLIKFN